MHHGKFTGNCRNGSKAGIVEHDAGGLGYSRSSPDSGPALAGARHGRDGPTSRHRRHARIEPDTLLLHGEGVVRRPELDVPGQLDHQLLPKEPDMMNPNTEQTTAVLQRDDRGPVAILTLNRPVKLNALSNELLAAIMRALDDIELDSAVRVIVITGAGRAFSAGADIAGFQRHLEMGPEEAVVNFMRPGQQMTRRVESYPKPIIAAVNGLAFGGGCELVESTHIALAAETATFSKAEINIGIMPTFGGTQRLPRNIGRKAAIELILTGRTFDAADAARLGLVNLVVSSVALLDEALALANLIATKPPLALAAALSAIHRGMDAAIDDGLAIEEAAFARIVSTHDAHEGVAAFLQKRAPKFLGR